MTLRLANERFATIAELLDWGCDCIDLTTPDDDDLLGEALDSASDELAKLSGMRFVGRKVVSGYRPKLPCSCGPACISLVSPVVSIQEVKVDGVVLSSSEWRLEGNLLHRVGTNYSRRSWGRQNLNAPATAENTVSVSYTWGHEITDLEKFACIELACDLIRAWTVSGGRTLMGVSTISGGGVSITRDEDEDQIREGGGALPLVSRFLARWNPREDSMFPAVFSPEMSACHDDCC